MYQADFGIFDVKRGIETMAIASFREVFAKREKIIFKMSLELLDIGLAPFALLEFILGIK